ncbi:hypothetical protein C9374_005655 [Naegleria lovaniensis]|uniref:Uncharacterized protein n=1 Tax=Naegleria lovaniensis TaxID=51637 RepID=A0AA88GP74_NAELO|nr:uncharacterized protein C9374_005653 [Naegleria lovaniensis]XP_044547541.1 uncharacterized protein C9374_005654 [Naegleria lovaniensis]XP_044547542.1 uncharacterized protein C9374_005655 [Naegleria lovaniensis]KAG2381861.1 hypothetical protein C9374_005653 [Naegleria lovaniensis]KAG2381862.1 hypothetical protein C9374_005654 [Naegleria lovaniensis]KAG2381863.1 hypothetical protein C9374_005655 [Naegleria lovaniensis]
MMRCYGPNVRKTLAKNNENSAAERIVIPEDHDHADDERIPTLIQIRMELLQLDEQMKQQPPPLEEDLHSIQQRMEYYQQKIAELKKSFKSDTDDMILVEKISTMNDIDELRRMLSGWAKK